MMTAAQDGFDFGFDGSNYGVEDDCIDLDYLFKIVDESTPCSDPNYTNDVFFPSSNNSQECGSTAQLANHQDLLLHQGYCAMSENNAPKMETLEQRPSTSPAEIMLADDNHPSASNNSIESHMCQFPNFVERSYFPSTHKLNFSANVPDQNLLDGSNYDYMLTNGQLLSDNKDHGDDFWPCNSWPENNRALDAQVESTNMCSSQAPMYGFVGGIGPESMLNGSHSVSTYDSSSSTTTDEASAETYMWGLMGQPCENHTVYMNGQRNNETLEGFESMFANANKGVPLEFSYASEAGRFNESNEAHFSVGEHGNAFVQHHIPGPSSANSCLQKKGSNETVQLVGVKSDPFKSSPQVIQASLSEHGKGGDDDDDDICIIENMSQPGQNYRPVTQKKSLVTPQRIPFTPKPAAVAPSPPAIGFSGIRQKPADERLIFQALVQDLSQPKSEAAPPDGVLEVPLLRHQRIALSWMVQKETTSLQCSGGILADDQGLGKTVSTIALILTERPPSRESKEKALKLETLDLDEDAEKSANKRTNGILENDVEASPSKERPSGGTLVVCPTSVLRQWAEELHNKVSSKAGLSVLVYHGSNRTKVPNEVAKFDVVLTTYSIVSMEVPRQSVNDKRNLDVDDEPITSDRKRKHSLSSDKKQRKKGTENELLESLARPLARVRWFRVVLDEAQSIKNFRTQVAQACWGLRAKRRWCLSGTPIQNAVDDLYSYFRFLKYDPYSVYNSFCSMVKNPISRNPSSGYRKLQAVLKTIMLRRTKGTRLDGKPIISLPPKSVKLMKVEFSEEERDFYSKLEADSRAQFLAYAESGTVKQNYVNILLLLLRLRQACDHPLLVQGFSSTSVVKSSIHMAKKLPQGKQIDLLNCLEGSLAICHICNDPPEDAVVSICSHVFCNQCISERLSGDDYQCLARNCKTQLSMSSIFSRATLKSCLSDSESSEPKESVEPAPFGHFDSSKLKAALKVLKSLSKPRVSASVKVCTKSADCNSGLLVESNATTGLDIKNSDTSNGVGIINSVVKEKAIVFSQWTRMLDMLEACLKDSNIEYRRLDGTMSVAARDKAVKDFNTRPEVTVMIMSLKAASLGLNMVAACHVLLLDLWWNPTTEDQAIDRAHRIGQTRPVTVVRLTVKDTVEDRILALQQRKRRLVASAFGEDESGSRETRLTVDDLKYLFMA